MRKGRDDNKKERKYFFHYSLRMVRDRLGGRERKRRKIGREGKEEKKDWERERKRKSFENEMNIGYAAVEVENMGYAIEVDMEYYAIEELIEKKSKILLKKHTGQGPVLQASNRY